MLFPLLFLFLAVNLCAFLFGQNELLNTVEFEVRSDKLSSPITIVQISDLHEKSFGSENSGLLEAVRSAKPDMIAVTGDMIFNSYTASPNLSYIEELAKGCAEIAPTFFVTGNHDRYHSQAVKKAFSQNGVTVLSGETIPVIIGGNRLIIGGIDDPDIDADSLERIDFPAGKDFCLLLAHRPGAFEQYAAAGAELVLCGHTHGGQIRLPWTKAIFYSDGGFFPEYSDGLYMLDGSSMVISMGLGSSVIPFRLFALPEVTVVHLLPEPAG